jgi:hypothetical protein
MLGRQAVNPQKTPGFSSEVTRLTLDRECSVI